MVWRASPVYACLEKGFRVPSEKCSPGCRFPRAKTLGLDPKNASLKAHKLAEFSLALGVRMSSDKLFGRFDDLLRLLLGFALTGLLGTYLAQTYTTRQADLAASQKIFSDQSTLIGKRYFAMNQVTSAYEENRENPGTWKSEEILTRWNAYRAVLQDWNSSRGFSREMIRLYFGNALWNKERDLHYMFRAWGQSLEAERKQDGAVDFQCLEKKLDELLSATHAFQFQLAAAIQAGKVGPNRDQSKVTENQRPGAFCLTNGSSRPSPPPLRSGEDGG